MISLGAKAEHVKASLRTREPAIAKQRHAAALAYLKRYWQAPALDISHRRRSSP